MFTNTIYTGASPRFWLGEYRTKMSLMNKLKFCIVLFNHTMYTSGAAKISVQKGTGSRNFPNKDFEKFI